MTTNYWDMLHKYDKYVTSTMKKRLIEKYGIDFIEKYVRCTTERFNAGQTADRVLMIYYGRNKEILPYILVAAAFIIVNEKHLSDIKKDLLSDYKKALSRFVSECGKG